MSDAQFGETSIPALSRTLFMADGTNSVVPHLRKPLFWFVIPMTMGACALAKSETEPGPILVGVCAVFAMVGGAVAGAKLHPLTEFRWKGILAGSLGAVSSLLACAQYIRWRFATAESVYSAELLFPMLAGLLPAALLYFLIMRNERVSATQAEQFKRRRTDPYSGGSTAE